ncbi:MAG: sigma-54-dependent Fis family transcriptional regulator [Deltaproteobacteria bacterium]|nr:MAG: sigma-54-dependent Fis family transcriptional regulator [Deltaproteobacteria bacterium]
MPRVLVVEDDQAVRELIVDELTDHGFTVRGAADATTGLAQLEADPIDVLITDVNLARESGLDLARDALAHEPDLPVIIITAFGSLEMAVEAIRAGAYDFITKPVSMEALALAVERAAGLRMLKDELAKLRVQARRGGRRSRLDGVSPEISRLRDNIATVAATDATVMVLGESGSGKEMVAREIHELSRRSSGPFVAENVAAIPAELLESTLFGHVRGAFTGATASRTGLFRMAHGGTLLLDEIGELPMELQPKLLRVLEEGRVRPVGSDQEIEVDVRLVVATHRDLEADTHTGRFREDLFYRLAVIDLAVPPLRDRGGDILLLAQLFLREKASALGKEHLTLHHDTAARLLGWHWPGNVRELRNAMERAVVLAQASKVLPRDLPPRIQGAPEPTRAAKAEADVLLPLDEVERRHILAVLRAHNGNKAEAARTLGIGRKTLYRKLEAWGLS